jgi:hypothetical protein
MLPEDEMDHWPSPKDANYFQKRDARALLLQCLDDDIKSMVLEHDDRTPTGIWKGLISIKRSVNTVTCTRIYSEISSLNMRSGDSLRGHVTRFLALYRRLLVTDFDTKDKVKWCQLDQSLLPVFNNITRAITRDKSLTSL